MASFGQPKCDAWPVVYVDGDSYHYAIYENGVSLYHIATRDVDEILYQVFRGVSQSLAIEFESAHRQEDRDTRRLRFGHELFLLGKLSEAWAERRREEQRQILSKAPLDDRANERSRLTVRYRGLGFTPEQAWDKACVDIPLPDKG